MVERAPREAASPDGGVFAGARGRRAVVVPPARTRSEFCHCASVSGTIRPTVQAGPESVGACPSKREEAALRISAGHRDRGSGHGQSHREVGAVGISGPQREIRAISAVSVPKSRDATRAPTEVVLTPAWPGPHSAPSGNGCGGCRIRRRRLAADVASGSVTRRPSGCSTNSTGCWRPALPEPTGPLPARSSVALHHPHPALPSVIVTVDFAGGRPHDCWCLRSAGPSRGVRAWAAETVTDSPGACRASPCVHDAATAEVGLVRRARRNCPRVAW